MKEKINTMNYIYEYLYINKIYYIFYALIICLLPIFRNFIIPELLGDFYDSVDDKNKSRTTLFYLFIIFAVMYFINILINYFAWRINPSIYEFIIMKLYDYIYDNTYGNQDVDISNLLVKMARLSCIYDELLIEFSERTSDEFISLIIGCIYFYFKLDPKYLFVFLIFILSIFIIQYINIKYIGTKYVRLRYDKYDNIYSTLYDSIKNMSTVHTYQNVSEEKNIIKRQIDKYSDVYFKSINSSIIIDISHNICILIMLLTLGYMLWDDFNKRKISRKIIFQISQIILLMALIGNYIEISGRNLTLNTGEIYDINNYINNNISAEIDKNIDDVNKFKNGDINFSAVSYKYNKSDNIILNNVSFNIKKGSKVAIIGQSGSGKSTIVKLLLKRIKNDIGTISINNVDISNIPTNIVASNIFYIPQTPILFNRTLYKNIIYGLKKNIPTQGDIIKLMESLDLKNIAGVFSNIMDKNVGKDGNKLSGGQRQIVWLLRSLYNMSPIIILDEPTASLDKDNKKNVMDIIKKMTIGKTVIIITHDDICPEYNKIYLSEGKVKNSFW